MTRLCKFLLSLVENPPPVTPVGGVTSHAYLFIYGVVIVYVYGSWLSLTMVMLPGRQRFVTRLPELRF